MSKKFDAALDYLLRRFEIASQTYGIATLHNDQEFLELCVKDKETFRQEIIKLVQSQIWFYKHEIADLSGNDDVYEEE